MIKKLFFVFVLLIGINCLNAMDDHIMSVEQFGRHYSIVKPLPSSAYIKKCLSKDGLLDLVNLTDIDLSSLANKNYDRSTLLVAVYFGWQRYGFWNYVSLAEDLKIIDATKAVTNSIWGY